METFDAMKRHTGWFMALGVALIILGLIAIVMSVVTTLISVMVFGWLLLIGGVFEVVHAFRVRTWGGVLLETLIGILNIIVGILIIGNPGASALALTLLIAAFFFVSGIFRIVNAAAEHFPSRGWAMFSGLVNILLGILIWMHWPASAFWVIGMFIGIDLLFTGWWFVTLSAFTRHGGTEPTMTSSPAT